MIDYLYVYQLPTITYFCRWRIIVELLALDADFQGVTFESTQCWLVREN